MRQRISFLRDLPREVAVLASIAFFVALGFGIVVPSIPIFAETFGASALAASAVVSAFAFMRFVSAPIAGSWVNRFGERRVLATGLAIVAVSSLLAGLAQNYPELIIMRAAGGLGSAMFSVSALALLLRVVSAQQRGRASAVWQGGFLIGGVTGPAVGALVLSFSIRAPFFFYAFTLAIAMFVALYFLHPKRIAALEESVEEEETPHEEQRTGWPELKAALGNPAYRAALGVNLATGLATFGLRSALVPLFVVEGLHAGPSLSGAAFLVAAASQAVLLLPAGRLADTRGRKPAMLIGTIATVIGLTTLVIDNGLSSDVMFFVAMSILGIGSAFLGSSPSAVVGDVMGGRKGGIVIATYQMVSDLGAVIGPLLGGLLLDLYGFSWAFGLGVAVSAVALVLVITMPETLKKPVQA